MVNGICGIVKDPDVCYVKIVNVKWNMWNLQRSNSLSCRTSGCYVKYMEIFSQHAKPQNHYFETAKNDIACMSNY